MTSNATPRRRNVGATTAAIGAAVAWLAVVGLCQKAMIEKDFTTGRADAAPATWPVQSGLTHDPQRPTLLVVAHPRCPCTRATLLELERLVARCGDRVQVVVDFTIDSAQGLAIDDAHDDLWNLARSIPGATVTADEGGIAAAAFHASTSGQTFLYAPDGALLFSGGITASRGHVGDNAGADAIAHLVAGRTSDTRVTPVFGCGLVGCSGSTTKEASP